MGRVNQCVQLVKVLYCKLPTIGKQLPTFPHIVRGFKLLTSEVGGECVSLFELLLIGILPETYNIGLRCLSGEHS